MQQTVNLGLKKPQGLHYFDVEHQNFNMELLDAKYAELFANLQNALEEINLLKQGGIGELKTKVMEIISGAKTWNSSNQSDTGFNTLLEVTGKQGKLNRMTYAGFLGDSDPQAFGFPGGLSFTELKITVDGNSKVIFTPAQPYELSERFDEFTPTADVNMIRRDWIGDVFFDNSLKIEFRKTRIGTGVLEYTFNYSTTN